MREARALSRSLRSDAGSQLGAATPEKEAEFPAVCSVEEGLLTPWIPDTNSAGSGATNLFFLVFVVPFFLFHVPSGLYSLSGAEGGPAAQRAKKL